MPEQKTEKPGFDEWTHWAQVVLDRLTACAHVYSKPPHEDVFMRDSERQARNAQTVDLLRRIHALIDESETPSDSIDDVDHHRERVVSGLALLLAETLRQLPELSGDMQKLLKSPWHGKCSGQIADILFRGPQGNEPEGIGSGHPEHGRLPEVLKDLLEREQIGDGRAPGKTGEPHREDDLAQRWSDHTGRSYRSGGGIE